MSGTGTRRQVVVTAECGDGWWALSCVEAHAVGQVRRLDDADVEMREMIAEALGIDPSSFDISLEISAGMVPENSLK